ncbi:hypothetical protein [Geothermobacter hydrogeniphilus]|uniref:Uncharacterized protein n=1 Tax=Geothermobacter hydrogeniphilus TaxID=1969733 RepID=A0A1X0Y5L5_9BACT|nr:hypothetical protein [Geothermobacter hydrogeniphilus]ORJ60426.1 hypothetical protein B5V00_07615 [Geothermobacter hydrogeniphilus]
MSRESLDSFLLQLGRWTSQVIESGRTPFRKVELNPPLIHPPCRDLPHLVLWINRDSHMAGGLILLPDGDIDQALATGVILADALGLKTFACWDRDQLGIWALNSGAAVKQETISAATVRSAGQFQQQLQSLLERLKFFAVANAPDNKELSALYLTNLLHLALLETTPELNESLRVCRSEQSPENSWPGGRDPGRSKVLLTLCRLLAVGHADLLPPTVVADGLERALRFACNQLPDELAGQLTPTAEEPPLPATAVARLHHVWRRLQQLGCLSNRTLLAEAVEWLPTGSEPLPTVFTESEQTDAEETGELVINPPEIPGDRTAAAEIGLPATLGRRTLLRWLRHRPQPRLQLAEIAALPADFKPDLIRGTLYPSPPPQRPQRPQLATALRIAWPSRRFSLPATAPRWHYDLLQLLGRAAPGARLEIRLPADWIDRADGQPLWELIRSDFQLTALFPERQEFICLQMVKSERNDINCVITGHRSNRELPWSELRRRPLSYLRLLLNWPEPLLQLVDRELLLLCDEQGCPEELAAVEQLYWQSSHGLRLAAWCGIDSRRLNKAGYRAERAGLPCCPHPDRLRRLANIAADITPDDSRFDSEVALWIGPELTNDNWPEAPERETGATAHERPSPTDLIEEIEERILVDGLPQFPTHYLYDHYRPQLTRYELHGELQECGRFFGQIALRDQHQEIQVDSDPLAACLLLASAGHRGPLDLPNDARVAADIARRYLTDLRRLRGELNREAHRLQEDPAAARRLVSRIWKRWELPGPDSIERVKAFLPETNQVE